MFDSEIFTNFALLIACYAYILLIILISGKIDSVFHISRKFSRKFLHVMIGKWEIIDAGRSIEDAGVEIQKLLCAS